MGGTPSFCIDHIINMNELKDNRAYRKYYFSVSYTATLNINAVPIFVHQPILLIFSFP